MDTESFDKGRDALKAGDYKAAESKFKLAFQSIDEQHALYNRVASFLGLAQVLVSDLNGLLLCRDAASSEARDGDVFLNLACAELQTENRGRAFDALARGRKIDRQHEQLIRACLLLDARRRNVIPLLPRDHFLNQLLGRLMRRSREKISVHDLLR
jgi:hypothetical protein